MLLDADTLALWRFGGQTFPVFDETGVNHLTSFPSGGIPLGGVGTINVGSAINDGMGWQSAAGNVAAQTALVGNANWSVEVWCTIAKRQSGNGTGRKCLTAYGGATSNPVDNFLASLWIRRSTVNPETQELSFVGITAYWEDLTNVDGAGTNFDSPLVIPTGVPVHLAIVKTGGVGTGTVEWFLNGVSIGSTTINTFVSAGGTNSLWAVGRHVNYGGPEFAFRGHVDEIRWSKKARSAAEILASFQRGDPSLPAPGPTGHEVDANTFALYRFDDGYPQPNGNVGWSDSAPGARHMLPEGGVTIDRVAVFPGIARRGGVLQNGNPFGGYRAQRATDLALRQMLRGEWTIEFLHMQYPSPQNNGTILTHSITTPNATPANFDCLRVRTNIIGGSGEINAMAAGWSNPSTGATTLVYSSFPGQLYRNTHWAIRKTLSGGTATLEFFANGVKTGYLFGSNGTLPNLTADSDGSNGVFTLGGQSDWMFGQLDEVRISNIARSDAAIMADYIACVGGGGGGGPDAVPPSITNILPSPGTPIYATSSVQLDVTDNLGLFRRVILLAKFLDGTYEVVFDGDAFSPKYPTSAVTTITNGYRFVLRRAEGWLPGGPTLVAFAYDQSGNEGT